MSKYCFNGVIGGIRLEKLFETEVYKEVLELANQQGYSLNIFSFDENSHYAKMGSGIHDFDYENKKIDIGIIESQSDQIGIYIHELLHAKLVLTGYPKIKTYRNFGRSVDIAILEIENIVHHSFVYPEMKRLGFEHKEIDEHYLQGVVNDTNTIFDGGNEINRALRLLEGYLRMSSKIDGIDIEVRRKQPKAHALYRNFRGYIKNTITPFDMSKAIIKTIKHVDAYVKQELKNDLYLRYFTRMEPILTENELKQKANNVFKALKFNEFEHVFLIKRKNDYCCYFLGLNMSIINDDLENLTVSDLLNKYALLAYKKG